ARARSRAAGRRRRSRAAPAGGTRRLAEGAAIAHLGRALAATTGTSFATVTTLAPFAAIEISFATARSHRFYLGPLRAEVESLQLAEVDFIQPLLVGFIGGLVIVHDWRKNGRGYPGIVLGLVWRFPAFGQARRREQCASRVNGDASAFRGFT